MRPAAARAAARPQADQRYRPTARPRSSPLALAPAHTLPPRARRPRTHWPQAHWLQGIPPRSRRQFSPGAISTSNHLSSKHLCPERTEDHAGGHLGWSRRFSGCGVLPILLGRTPRSLTGNVAAGVELPAEGGRDAMGITPAEGAGRGGLGDPDFG